MKSLRASIVLPVLVLIVVLGFGAGTALAFAGTSSSGGGNLGAAQDVTGPVISEVEAKDIEPTSGEITWQATITWKTDELSDSEVKYSTSRAFNLKTTIFTNTGDTDPMVTVHAMALEGLSPNKKYYFMVTSADEFGNTSTDDNGGSLPGGKFYSFTTRGEKISELEEGDPTVTTETETGLVSKAFVGTWTVTGSDVALGVDPVAGSGVTLVQQGTGKRVPLTMPTSDEVTLAATGAGSGAGVVKWPGSEKRTGTLAEIEDGARVVVKAEYVGEEWVVRSVIVKPKVKPDHLPAQGVVRTVEGGQVTIVTASGKSHTFDFKDNRGKSGGVHSGDSVTVFHGGSGKAKGLVTHEQVAIRLEGFQAEIEAEDDADDVEGVVGNKTAVERSNHRVQQAAKLESLQERLAAKQLEQLARALDRSHDKVTVDLEAARARLEAQWERRQAKFALLWAKLDAKRGADHRGKPDGVPSAEEQAQSDGADGETPSGGGARGPATPATPHADGGEEPAGDGGVRPVRPTPAQ